MQHRNNLLTGFIIVAALFLAAFPMDWYHGLFSVTGRNGSLGFPGTPKLPIWFLLSISAAAVVVLGLNAAKVTAIPRWPLMVVLFLCGVYYALPLLYPEVGHYPNTGEPFTLWPEAGPFIALGATLGAFILGAVGGRARPNPALERTPTAGNAGPIGDAHTPQ